jgi:hypothetical protein
VPDSCLEVYLGRLERVVGGQNKEELEFAALEKRSALATIPIWKEIEGERGKDARHKAILQAHP